MPSDDRQCQPHLGPVGIANLIRWNQLAPLASEKLKALHLVIASSCQSHRNKAASLLSLVFLFLLFIFQVRVSL